jgi:hypothetical protein
LIRELNSKCDLSLKEPLFISELPSDKLKKESNTASKTKKAKTDQGQEKLF